LKSDFPDHPFLIDDELQADFIAAERIESFCTPVCMLQGVKIPGLFMVV
jgi:hypothetical protein